MEKEKYSDFCQKHSLAGWVDAEGYEGRKGDRIVIWMHLIGPDADGKTIVVHVDADQKYILSKYVPIGQPPLDS